MEETALERGLDSKVIKMYSKEDVFVYRPD
jgi:hypothetical protein